MRAFEVMLLSSAGMSLTMLGILWTLGESKIKGLKEWQAANLLSLLALVLYAIGWRWSPFLVLELANTVYGGAAVLAAGGFRKFYGKPTMYRLMVGLLPVLFVLLSYFHYVVDSTSARIVLMSLFHGMTVVIVFRTVRSVEPSSVTRIPLMFARVLAVVTVFFLAIRLATQIPLYSGTPLNMIDFLDGRNIVYLTIGMLLMPAMTLAGASLATVRLVQMARKEARTDFLTGAWTRRALLEFAQREMDRLARTGHPLSLLLLDVDDFKLINDSQGHLAGDRVLTALASNGSRVVRSTDYFCRIGGEEFAVLMPDTDARTAAEAAERLRFALAGSCTDNLAFTVSIGVAELLPGQGWLDLYEAADSALSLAKSGGKNRVVTASVHPVLEQTA